MRLVKVIIFLIFGLFYQINLGQERDDIFLNLDFSIGKTSPPNFNFPELNSQKSLMIGFGKTNFNPDLVWAKLLNYPETGITFSYTNFGNNLVLGQAISFTPYLDLKIFNKRTQKINLKTELGFSYFNKTFDEIDNPINKAISSNFTWAFRMSLYYKILEKENYNLKLGMGYFHNSNGHLRLPNNGLNVFTVNLSSQIGLKKNEIIYSNVDSINNKNSVNRQKYYSFRFGIGQKVFSQSDISKKEVYVLAASKGIIVNKTFKFGYGFCYRFYKDYYDFVKNDSYLLTKNNSELLASNFALFANSEILLSHFGIELEFGVNLYKPIYKYDYEINNGKIKNGIYEKPELDWYYDIKKTISSRLGLKYYFLNNNKSPIQNLFLGGFINANFGQADFSELTFGYVYCLESKTKKDNHF
jgi:Lipid A 3-O-deacylase (PagL)